ncbi:hypothetical protein [Odoribacter lunatus]|uniref:hypothetical protein n=1 Tax=Odoribacter lunatus TaxID=2941335 RepID=UPI002041CA64|nr:hypothetical protein [Odoribacter lunatus]
MDLTGKWKYREDYGYGTAEGELFLTQNEGHLSGKIVFTDNVADNDKYMIQEFVEGKLEDMKVRLDAYEFDIIHSEHDIRYELDRWFGVLVDEKTIKGISEDEQGIGGVFLFEKLDV